MYEGHFGFADNPFRLTSDPHYLYLTESHKEALASLIYGIRARKGFVAVLGEAGTGKTTLLRYLLGQIEQTVRAVCILNTNVAFEEILGFVLRDLGIEAAGASKTEALEAFNRFLHAEFAAGRNVVILVDEAQNLSPVALEELRMLSNFETAKAKLLQIILAGQLHLSDLLAKPEMQQVRQRIGLVCTLDPLSPQDTSAYIEHRLRAAGYRGKRLFTRRAVSAVWKHSRGIPRLINVLCDNALIAAYGSRDMRIGPRLVRAAAADLEQSAKASLAFPVSFKWRFRTAAAVGLLLLGLGVEPLVSRYSPPLRQAPPQSESESGSAAHDRRPPPPEQLAERTPPEPLYAPEGGSSSPPTAHPTASGSDDAQLLQILRGSTSGLTSQGPSPLLKTLTVRPGDTLSSLAASVYGDASPLALDLVMSVNPEVKSIDRISVGHTLLFPDVSPERLVRRTADGRHVIHAATVSSAARAAELQARLRQQGHTVSILPVSVSATQQWFRVLVGEFHAAEDAVKFWRSTKW